MRNPDTTFPEAIQLKTKEDVAESKPLPSSGALINPKNSITDQQGF